MYIMGSSDTREIVVCPSTTLSVALWVVPRIYSNHGLYTSGIVHVFKMVAFFQLWRRYGAPRKQISAQVSYSTP